MRDFPQQGHIVQRSPGPDGDGGEGILCQHDREASGLPEQHVEVAQLRAAADEHDALVDDVRRQLGRRPLEGPLDRVDDRA